MNCETARILMETGDPRLDEHLRSCPNCIIGATAQYYEAPAGLDQKILSTLRKEQTAPPALWRWAAIAAMFLLAVSLAWNFAQLRSRGQLLASSIVSAHVRSLAGTHLLDVPSSDRHTVKPWFNGKLDFSPAVKDFDGFPLLGGRLEYLEDRPAAALVYGRNKHIINLFTWPVATQTPESSETHNGYHLLNWSEGGMTYWAISDLNETELRQFVSAYRQTN